MTPSTDIALSDLGPSPVLGHRLVILRLADVVVQQWILGICSEGSVHQTLAEQPAENIILSLRTEIPLQDILTGILEDGHKLLGVLIASRGCAQSEPCEKCMATNGKSPFEKCFLAEGLEFLGCASCVYKFDDDLETLPDCCSHTVTALAELRDGSEDSLDD